MKQKVFRPKMEDKCYLEKFEIALNDHIGIYKIIVAKVRDELGITDDRAVQAAAFTLWKQTTDTLSIPNLSFWAPSDLVDDNLENFEEYAEWYGNKPDAFVRLCSEYINQDESDIRAWLRSPMEITADKFAKVVDFLALAEIVNIIAEIMMGIADEEDEAVINDIKLLTAKAFGEQIGKSVDDIIGSTE